MKTILCCLIIHRCQAVHKVYFLSHLLPKYAVMTGTVLGLPGTAVELT